MIDVFNAYHRLPTPGVPAKVREIGFGKAKKAIPWVQAQPEKIEAIFAACRNTSEKDLISRLRSDFPLKG
jgi:hypothetical protein